MNLIGVKANLSTSLVVQVKRLAAYHGVHYGDLVGYACQCWVDRKAGRQSISLPEYMGELPSMSGYVYVIREAGGLYKIGMSTKPKTRMNRLHSDGVLNRIVERPFKFSIVHLHRVTNMRASELRAHRRFRHCRVAGEWFRMTADDVARFIEMNMASRDELALVEM